MMQNQRTLTKTFSELKFIAFSLVCTFKQFDMAARRGQIEEQCRIERVPLAIKNIFGSLN